MRIGNAIDIQRDKALSRMTPRLLTWGVKKGAVVDPTEMV